MSYHEADKSTAQEPFLQRPAMPDPPRRTLLDRIGDFANDHPDAVAIGFISSLVVAVSGAAFFLAYVAIRVLHWLIG